MLLTLKTIAKEFPTRRFSLLLSAALVALFLAQAGLSFAHAHYKSSNIAPDSTVTTAPATLTITFGEETSPTQTKVQVLDATGKVVDKGDLKVDGPTVTLGLGTLTDGKYNVKYRTLTEDDGGIVEGSFAFTVARSGSASAGTGKAQENESSQAPSAAPATGLGAAQADTAFQPGLLFGLLSLTMLAGAGLLVSRRVRRH